jgi:AcrR family transcriptional regulator
VRTGVDDHSPDSATSEVRPRRADARRNVEALLDAAKTVFAEAGVDAPAKQITDLAGVGVGTLYRHFPRRSDLVVAVMNHEVNDCAAMAATFAASYKPWPALTAWVERLTGLFATKRGLAAALHSGDPAFADLLWNLMGVLEPAVQVLLTAAQDAGDLRADITARDLLLIVALMCQPAPSSDAHFNEKMIRIFLTGLRHGFGSDHFG